MIRTDHDSLIQSNKKDAVRWGSVLGSFYPSTVYCLTTLQLVARTTLESSLRIKKMLESQAPFYLYEVLTSSPT